MRTGKVAFIGMGIIGAGLAVNALTAGNECVLYDVADLEASKTRLYNILGSMVEAEAFSADVAHEAYGRARFTNDLSEAVTDAVFIQESVPERMDLKRDIFRQIQEVTGDKPVIASATTALMPSELQKEALYPERILVGHPYNPSYILPLVEIVGGKQTSQESVDYAKEIYESWGKVAVICLKEVYGYIAQHINWGIRDIALKVVKDGICTPEDIDKAIMYGPGMRLPITGQLLTLSMGVEGGWKNFYKKYYGQEATEFDYWLDDQLNQELENRPKEIGNTLESALKFRDHMLVSELKVQGLL
ncbi:MAG: 3-hydroxyacyl-CoA dehydrogenase family protein [Eubacterium sp.]|nr:3-hydroxyacyl-CoA dehydrogenase family protein [Eubacterium sp.]